MPHIPSLEPGASQAPSPSPARPPIALTNLHLLADLYQLGHLVLQFTVAFNQVGEIRLQGLLQVQKWGRRKRKNRKISKGGGLSPLPQRGHLPPNTPPEGATT